MNREDKPGEKLTGSRQRQRQVCFHSQRQSQDDFQSDLLIGTVRMYCNSIADKTKKVIAACMQQLCHTF